MILIISINNDKSTFDVAKWLLCNNTKYEVLIKVKNAEEWIRKIDNKETEGKYYILQ